MKNFYVVTILMIVLTVFIVANINAAITTGGSVKPKIHIIKKAHGIRSIDLVKPYEACPELFIRPASQMKTRGDGIQIRPANQREHPEVLRRCQLD